MHGMNAVRKYSSDGLYLQVHKVFLTIQGEGPFSGHRAVFIRLTGCNLRCWWCDTEWDDENDRRLPVDSIVDIVDELAQGAKLVVLTGGEPCRQNLEELVYQLRLHNYTIQVETAGTIWQDCLLHTTIVISPKTAKVEPRFYQHAAHWKYPLLHSEIDATGLPLTNTQDFFGAKHRLARPPASATVYITPVDQNDPEKDGLNRQAVVQAALQHGYIAQVQLHKELSVP
jgi:7-carboxy-7-deazaguanine synthase